MLTYLKFNCQIAFVPVVVEQLLVQGIFSGKRCNMLLHVQFPSSKNVYPALSPST